MRNSIPFVLIVLVLGLAGNVSAELPAGWSSQDIGTDGGSATCDDVNGVWTIVADGRDIWGTSDQFHYVYLPARSDCEIIARVSSIVNTDDWAKAGVMIRETLAADSKFVDVVMTPLDGMRCVSLQLRVETGGVAGELWSGLSSLPQWVKLVREGDSFTGYHSDDGFSWVEIDNTTVLMSQDVYLGLAVTSHSSGTLTTAVISNVTITDFAYNPSPYDGAVDVPIDANLGWERGKYCIQDQVYFGTNSASLPLVGTITNMSLPPLYEPLSDLITSTTYYWRVDETGSNTMHTGNLWSFTTVSGSARCDSPADGDAIYGELYPSSPPYTHIWTKLIFDPGPTAVKHTGYFSDDYSKVYDRHEDANLGQPISNQPPWDTTFIAGHPQIAPANDTLVRGTWYYWCVDETDALDNTYPGDIWEFGIQGHKAFNPSPKNGAEYVDPNVLLSWLPGFSVEVHDIYMGTDFNDVNNAVYDFNSLPPEFVATRWEWDPNYQCNGLPYNTKLYWRVDEVRGRVPPIFIPREFYKGDIWEFTTTPSGLGTIYYELWENISGYLDALLADPCYPGYPTSSGQLTTFDTEPVLPDIDYYGGQIEGLLYPPITGDYTFWIATDEDGELWLSTDEKPCSAELIAYISAGSYANPYEFEKYSSQNSEPISLDNTRKYYIMARWKEDLGNDHCMVAWQGPSMAEKEVIPGGNLAPFFQHPWAWLPTPHDGTNVGDEEAISLNWLPGDGVVSHDVYFGTDQAAVTDASRSSPEFQINLPLGTDSYMVTDLIPFTTYYWRIDEVHESNVSKGCIWFFITGIDCNGNGIPDDIDIATGTSQDINGNGVPDECEPDCNGNGIPDSYDISQGTSSDINNDGIPDECQFDIMIVPVAVLDDPAQTSEVRTELPESIAEAPAGSTYYIEIWATDSGSNENTGLTSVYVGISFCGQMSATELQHGTIFTMFPSGTIQPSGVDEVDEFGGSSLPSGIEPNWVRVGWVEMSADDEVSVCTVSLLQSFGGVAALDRGLIPWEDIYLGSLTLLRDCNGNGIPDVNDIANGTSKDCNGNGIPDECDIARGDSSDCNGNGKPDECDIADGTSTDGNGDGIPDECQLDVRVVPVATMIDPNITSEVRTTLPDSAEAVVRGSIYYVEIWASDVGNTNTGLTGVYVDLSFCGDTSATGIEHGTIFTTSPSGTIGPGSVDEFGGLAVPDGGGIEPEWVRVGWVRMSADVDTPSCTINLLPSSTGVSTLHGGILPWVYVELNTVSLEITPPARSYNLDGFEPIGPGDWSYFIGSWLQPVPPADAEDDFDCDCFVGVGDLSWFATGWMKFTDDPTILYPPCPDPNCGESMSAGAANAGMMSAATGTLDTSTDVAFEVVVLDAQSGSDTTTTLPVSVDQITSGQTYYVEVWVSDVGDIDTGVTSAYVDLSFPDDVLSVVSISHSGIFTTLPTGSAGSSVIDELGGSTLSEGIGVEPQWARVAVVQMYADAASPFVLFTLSPSSTGISSFGRGIIPWNDISLGSFIIGPPADLNDNGRVDLFDVAILARQWRLAPGDPSADIAPEPLDGVVDWFDLAALLEYWLGGITP